MTIVGSVIDHEGLVRGGGDHRFEGIHGSSQNDEFLDLATYFVGEHGSRGLPLGSDLAVLTTDVDDQGWKTWNVILPSLPTRKSVGRRIVLTLTETPNREMYADKTKLTFSYTSGKQKITAFEALSDSDHELLYSVKNGLERWLLGDREVPEVA